MTRCYLRILTIIIPCIALILTTVSLYHFTPTFAASSTIALSTTSGPPTSIIKVHGSGYQSNEKVTIYFDTTQVGTPLAGAGGAFVASITVPSSALPGNHMIHAVGLSSGYRAKAPFLVQTDWAMYGFGSYDTNFNRYENVLSPTNVATLVPDWTYAISSVYSSPVIANGIVYVGSQDTTLSAFNASNGTLLWKYETGQQIYSSPAVVNGVVYVGTWSKYSGQYFYALNATTGALLWKHRTGSHFYFSPVVVNGMVYVGTYDHTFYALNAATGNDVWKFTTTEDSNSASPAVAYVPALHQWVVYFTTYITLYALNAATGALLWSYPIDSNSPPAVSYGVVYLTSDQLYALNAATGALLWSFNAQSISGYTPAVANGVVYVGCYVVGNSGICAIDAYNGTFLWKYSTGGSYESSSIVANGVVYYRISGSSNAGIYALNANNGAFLWDSVANLALISPPAVANGVLYFGLNGNLFAYHLSGTTSSKR